MCMHSKATTQTTEPNRHCMMHNHMPILKCCFANRPPIAKKVQRAPALPNGHSTAAPPRKQPPRGQGGLTTVRTRFFGDPGDSMFGVP